MTKVKLISALFLIVLTGCGTKVARVQPDTTIDMTGKWNDADSRMVAEEMIDDCLGRPWIAKYAETLPTVIVGNVVNRSHEHINTQTFVKNMEMALINSGKVSFVASAQERDQIRDERDDQQVNSSVQSAKMNHEESGADLMLLGSINTIVDQEGKKAVLYYQTNLELIEVQSNKKVWIGEKKIKKYVTRTKTKF